MKIQTLSCVSFLSLISPKPQTNLGNGTILKKEGVFTLLLAQKNSDSLKVNTKNISAFKSIQIETHLLSFWLDMKQVVSRASLSSGTSFSGSLKM